jgi:hypothetical protein
MMPSYLDFELEIGDGLGRDYPVAVLRLPAGETQATIRFPFDELQLESRLKDLQVALLRSGGKRRTVLTREEQAVQDLGRALFDTLLAGEDRSLCDVSKARAAEAGQGRRVKLCVASPSLAALPWEYLGDAQWSLDRVDYGSATLDTTPVGSHSPQGDSATGAADMRRNVVEWTTTAYTSYPCDAGDGREDPATGVDLVIRGGSFMVEVGAVRRTYRNDWDPAEYEDRLEFRVVCETQPLVG